MYGFLPSLALRFRTWPAVFLAFLVFSSIGSDHAAQAQGAGQTPQLVVTPGEAVLPRGVGGALLVTFQMQGGSGLMRSVGQGQFCFDVNINRSCASLGSVADNPRSDTLVLSPETPEASETAYLERRAAKDALTFSSRVYYVRTFEDEAGTWHYAAVAIEQKEPEILTLSSLSVTAQDNRGDRSSPKMRVVEVTPETLSTGGVTLTFDYDGEGLVAGWWEVFTPQYREPNALVSQADADLSDREWQDKQARSFLPLHYFVARVSGEGEASIPGPAYDALPLTQDHSYRLLLHLLRATDAPPYEPKVEGATPSILYNPAKGLRLLHTPTPLGVSVPLPRFAPKFDRPPPPRLSWDLDQALGAETVRLERLDLPDGDPEKIMEAAVGPGLADLPQSWVEAAQSKMLEVAFSTLDSAGQPVGPRSTLRIMYP